MEWISTSEYVVTLVTSIWIAIQHENAPRNILQGSPWKSSKLTYKNIPKHREQLSLEDKKFLYFSCFRGFLESCSNIMWDKHTLKKMSYDYCFLQAVRDASTVCVGHMDPPGWRPGYSYHLFICCWRRWYTQCCGYFREDLDLREHLYIALLSYERVQLWSKNKLPTWRLYSLCLDSVKEKQSSAIHSECSIERMWKAAELSVETSASSANFQ